MTQSSHRNAGGESENQMKTTMKLTRLRRRMSTILRQLKEHKWLAM
jgi:hypothetical protein